MPMKEEAPFASRVVVYTNDMDSVDFIATMGKWKTK